MLETREFETRTTTEGREVIGIAVPWDAPANIGRYTETFKRGAVQPTGDVKLFYGHAEPIGTIRSYEDTDDGWQIRAVISDTPRGNEVLTLIKDNVLNRFSIGFVPLEEEKGNGTIIRTKVDAKEVSVVAFPAYRDAVITETREENIVTDVVQKVDLDEVKDSLDELKREFANMTIVERTPAVDTRSAGEVVKALARNDAEAVSAYNTMQERAYTGGTLADSVVKPAWVGDLTRIVEEASPLRAMFSSAALPEKGMSVEYAQLKTNTISVAEQAKEGDNLVYGKVQIETKSAPVKTFGGYTELSIQEIERSNVNILDTSLRAMAAAAGKAINAFIAADYKALYAAQSANKLTVSAAGKYNAWLSACVDAAVKFENQGLTLDGLVVDPTTFKDLMALQGSDGRPVMLVTGNGMNNIGSIDVKGLVGDLASIKVVMSGALTNEVAFVNRNAIKLYTSPLVRLQDTNIINLTKDFSVYTLAAVADEIPTGIIPVAKVA